MDFLTSYIHHPVFLWISYFCITGDGLFVTCRPFAVTFAMMYLEEIPTFLLGLGTVFPSMRSDLAFGVTFFLFRLTYHIAMAAYGFYCGIDTPLFMLFVLTSILHLFWFSSWISKYGKVLTGGKSSKKVADKAH